MTGDADKPPPPPEDERTILSPGGFGTPASEQTPPPPSQPSGDELPKIPGITIAHEIARGGMGVVYRGRQDYLDREVAVKVLSDQLQDESFAARFQREAKILANISHPNIVGCHIAGVTEHGRCYLVMEFIDGQNLQEWLDENGSMPPRSGLRVIRSLCRALAHASEQGVIHRDIKAANVLMDGSSRVDVDPHFPFEPKLVDLGLAKFTHGAVDMMLTSPGTVVGTPSTMSPEQFDDPDNVDFRADIYGLGCILHRALTGVAAYDHSSMTTMIVKKRQKFGPDPAKSHGLPGPIGELVSRMLACDRADRPSSYGQLIGELDQLHAALQNEPTQVGGGQPTVGGESTPRPKSGAESKLLKTAELKFLIDTDDATATPPPAAPSGFDATGVQPAPPKVPPPKPPSRPAQKQGSPLAKVGIAIGSLAVVAAVAWAAWPESRKRPETDPVVGSGDTPRVDPAKDPSAEPPENSPIKPPAAVNRPPTAAIQAPASARIGAEIELRSTVADPDDDTLTLRWRQVGSPLSTIRSPEAQITTLTIDDALPGDDDRVIVELVVDDRNHDAVVARHEIVVEGLEASHMFGAERESALDLWRNDGPTGSHWTPTEDGDIACIAAAALGEMSTELPGDLWRTVGEIEPKGVYHPSGDRYPSDVGVRVDFADRSLAIRCLRTGDSWRLELCAATKQDDGYDYVLIPGVEPVEWKGGAPAFFELTRRSSQLECVFGETDGGARRIVLPCPEPGATARLAMFVRGGRALFRGFELE